MARYTGPRLRISRRFNTAIFGPSKYLDRKDYPPGQHGQSRRRKATDYAMALAEKQKMRYYYGLMEKQFRGVYKKAIRRRGVTGEIMLQILETRLDSVVFSLGFGYTRAQARQMVTHGHVLVNDKRARRDGGGDGHERHHFLLAASGQLGKETANGLDAVLRVAGNADDGL